MGSVHIILGKSQYQFRQNTTSDPAVLADRKSDLNENSNDINSFELKSSEL